MRLSSLIAVLGALCLVDLAFPTLACLLCGPPVAEGCPAALSQRIAYLVRRTYFYGESSLDLWAVALARVCLFVVLCFARLGISVPIKEGPLLDPLPTAQAINTREDAALSVSIPRRRLSGRATVGLAAAVSLATLCYAISKAFARLVQSGSDDGDGLGILDAAGTTPPAAAFWACNVIHYALKWRQSRVGVLLRGVLCLASATTLRDSRCRRCRWGR